MLWVDQNRWNELHRSKILVGLLMHHEAMLGGRVWVSLHTRHSWLLLLRSFVGLVLVHFTLCYFDLFKWILLRVTLLQFVFTVFLNILNLNHVSLLILLAIRAHLNDRLLIWTSYTTCCLQECREIGGLWSGEQARYTCRNDWLTTEADYWVFYSNTTDSWLTKVAKIDVMTC